MPLPGVTLTKKPSSLQGREYIPALPPTLPNGQLLPLYRAAPVMIRHQPLQGGTACPSTGSHHPPALCRNKTLGFPFNALPYKFSFDYSSSPWQSQVSFSQKQLLRHREKFSLPRLSAPAWQEYRYCRPE
jgi:hypothetical protein